MTISWHWPWHNILLHWQVTGKQVGRLIFHRGTVRDCSWHPTQPMLVSSSWDGNLAKWEHLHGDKPQVSKLCSARFPQFEVDSQFDSEWQFFTFSFSHLCLSQAQCHILHVISWFLFMAIECLCELWPKIPKKENALYERQNCWNFAQIEKVYMRLKMMITWLVATNYKSWTLYTMSWGG
jgi:hypothetical protein